MTFIIGLAGPGKVGKSTTAKSAVASFAKLFPDIRVIRYAFATPIYEMAASITGWEIDKLKDLKYKELAWTVETAPLPCLIGWSPRSFLQRIGTECFRQNISDRFWIDLSLKKVSEYDIAIIEDARFENEYKVCDIVVELEREGVEYARNHASAMPPDPKYVAKKVKIDSADFNIDNGVLWLASQVISKKNRK